MSISFDEQPSVTNYINAFAILRMIFVRIANIHTSYFN